MRSTRNSSASSPPPGRRRRADERQTKGPRLLDRHRALLPADGLHRLRATATAGCGRGVHPSRLSRLLPGGALVGQALRRGAAAGAGAGAAQGVGLRRLRHHPRLGAHRPPVGGRRPGGLGLGRGHQRALGPLVLLLAPPSGRATKGRKMKSQQKAAGQAASELISEKIAELGDWRGDTLARMRALIREADADVVEEWKWMGTPVWSHDGGICTGESYKSVVKLTFFKGASLEDPAKLFNSSLDGNVRRAIDIHEGEEIDANAFKALIHAAVAFNISGG